MSEQKSECVLVLGRYDDLYPHGITTINIQPLRGTFVPEKIVIPESIGRAFTILSVNVNGDEILDLAGPDEGSNDIPAELAMPPGLPFFKKTPVSPSDTITVVVRNMEPMSKRFMGVIIGRER